MLRPRGLCRPRLARRPTPAFHRALAICRLQPRRTPRIQNNSGLPQGPAGASAAASACGKLRFAGFGRARRGCMLDMRRREFITLLGAAAWPLAARAQQLSKLPRIGFLQRVRDENVVAFIQALRDAGYVDGQNAVIETRIFETTLDRLPDLAKELVDLKCEVILAASQYAFVAAMRATTTIPIVGIDLENDPVASGWVKSLA